MKRSVQTRRGITALAAILCALAAQAIAAAPKQQPPAPPPMTPMTGSLVVQLGCGDAQGLVQLAKTGNLVVQGLDREQARVDAAIRALREAGTLGRASAMTLTSPRLPYAEQMANVIIVNDPCGVSDAEILRVLVPGGCVWRHAGGKWTSAVKPWPTDIDEWTHWLHGADCNAVAKDKRVGPPERMKWIAAPYWSRSHHTVPSVTSMVSAGGRVFYIVDDAPSGMSGNAPDKWELVARDAFNGMFLWRKSIPKWGWQTWSDEWTCRFTIPTHMPRRLVAVGDRVYVTLDFNAPLTELDAATGKLLRTFDGTRFTDEILCDNGLLIVAVNHAAQHPDAGAKLRAGQPGEPATKKSVAAIDVATGKMRWKVGDFEGLHSKTGSMDRITHLSMCAGGGKVYLMDRERIVAIDLADGHTAWTTPRPEVPEHKMRYNIRITDMCSPVYHDGMLFVAQLDPAGRIGWREVRGKLHALDAATGKEVWSRPCASWGWGAPADVFCLDGLVWVDDYKDPHVLGLDPETGEVQRKVSNFKAFDNGHHHRCYRNKATERFMITSYRGLEFTDFAGELETSLNHWVRGVCRYGVMPANGLVYATPDPCDCYISSKVDGFVALAAKATRDANQPAAPQLVRGPAYPADPATPAPQTPAAPSAEDWPTYRRDNRRSGSSASPAPTKLTPAWQTDIAGCPTATTAVGECVYAANAANEVVALDARTGAIRWRYAVAGPVDTPPTVAGETVVFGSADGWTTCLRADDGKLVWRFRGAPGERLIGAFDRVESAWPIHGCVLVRDHKAYFTAGRSSFLDGGIFATELDVRTGNVLAAKPLASDHDMKVDKGRDPLEDTGLLDDILVAGKAGIHMRRAVIFGDANDLTAGDVLRSTGPGGLLEDTWNPRERWYIGDVSCAEYCVFDATSVYGIRARADINGYGGFFEPGKEGYELFAAGLPFKPVKKGKQFVKRWSVRVPVKVIAMVVAGDTLLAAGTPDELEPKAPWAAYEGKRGGVLMAISAKDGHVIRQTKLDAAPVLDGLTLQRGRLFVSTVDGKVRCFK